ncbi:MAG: ribosomal protein S18-alanine N-acetyltransferase [Deltaproteobacteria bacterium]|jgi:ribosomal-protein-alanine N-acetyltransferase|nr:ribosomal protein S18-alanine N-acetyltransferase [Deltaproteobacteria bacterium]
MQTLLKDIPKKELLNPPSIFFRRLTLDDLKDLLTIERELYPQPWTMENFEEEISRAFSLSFGVFSLDNTLLGFIISWILGDEVHILNLAVRQKYQRQGLGTKLLQILIQLSRKKDCLTIYLDVNEFNSVARDLYRKIGFREEGYRPKYYSSTEGAILMTLTLNNSKSSPKEKIY